MSSLDAPLTDGSATLRIPSHRSSAHYNITSRTHDWQSTPLAVSVSTAHVHTVCTPGPEDKAYPSNLLVSKDAPVQSQHMHSTGACQPTTTLGSGHNFCCPSRQDILLTNQACYFRHEVQGGDGLSWRAVSIKTPPSHWEDTHGSWFTLPTALFHPFVLKMRWPTLTAHRYSSWCSWNFYLCGGSWSRNYLWKNWWSGQLLHLSYGWLCNPTSQEKGPHPLKL